MSKSATFGHVTLATREADGIPKESPNIQGLMFRRKRCSKMKESLHLAWESCTRGCKRWSHGKRFIIFICVVLLMALYSHLHPPTC